MIRLDECGLAVPVRRRNELQRLQDRGGLDFTSAVQRLVEDGGDPLQSQHSPTVEVVDQTLDRVASTCTFSSPEHRNRFKAKPVDPSQELMGIFRRMSGLEAKWILLHLPKIVTIQLSHTALPWAFEVRRSLAGALELLIHRSDCNTVTFHLGQGSQDNGAVD